MKKSVTGSHIPDETDLSSVYIWQDAGFQVMTGFQYSSACDMVQVRTKRLLRRSVSFMENGMPAVQGENGLNVQGKMSLTDPRNPL